MNLGITLGMGLVAIVALVVGWALGARSVRSTTAAQAETLRESREELERLRQERDPLVADRAAFKQRAEELQQRTADQNAEITTLRTEIASLNAESARQQEKLKAGQEALASERQLLADARKALGDTFKSLASDSLKENNAQFFGIANREFSAKEDSIDKLLQPMRESLGKLEAETKQLEVKREGAYQEVLNEIRNIKESHQTLSQETSQLVQALRAPKARGNWGELQLQRCIEFAGMVEYCSFDVQAYMRGDEDESAQRPDVIVRLPNERAIVIDAKTPLDAFLSAMSATDESQRATLLERHALQVRTHLDQLGSKKYWERFRDSPDFVVCFLPSEVLFSAALEENPDLIEIGSHLNVILATPTTLIALLKAVAYGWQQMEITRNAIAICETGEKLYKKLASAQEHFTKMGNALGSSVKHYNNLVGAMEGRGSVFPLAAKLHELKIGQEEIPEIAPIETSVRELQSSHWDDSVDLAAVEDTPET